MKYIFSLITIVILTGFCYTDSFYDQSLRSIDNQPIDLTQYRGKKVLLIILPVSLGDSAVAPSDLSALGTQYSDSLVIIGIPAIEYGYSQGNKTQIKELYAGQPSNFILAEGMKVQKSAGGEQSSVFRWLTDINKNKFFDKDAVAVGQKFFVNKQGQLYAVTGPHIRLSNPIMNRIISRYTTE